MEEVTTADAPANDRPYSQAIIDGTRVFVSGQGPVDPDTGEIEEGDIESQTAQVLENIQSILAAADSSLNDVVKTTIFLTDIGQYNAVNEEYGKHFDPPFPARSAVEVSNLPSDIDVEIEVVAKR